MAAPAHRGAVVVEPGAGRRVGNVEFLCLTDDSPRFNFSIITIQPGRGGPPSHVHEDEDDAFFILEGELTFVVSGEELRAPAGTFVLVPPGTEHTFANGGTAPVRMLNLHAPAGFDRRLLSD